MPVRTPRFRVRQIVCFVLFALMLAAAQKHPDGQKNDGNNKDAPNKPPTPVVPGADYSGMYSFLRDGEFVQITIEDQGRVTGFVSRYGDSEGDRGVFLDHFFKSGKLDGHQLVFATEIVHGTWFEFLGTVERGEGKNRADEAYYVLTGTLVENTTDATKKTSSNSHAVTFKAFPQDVAPAETQK